MDRIHRRNLSISTKFSRYLKGQGSKWCVCCLCQQLEGRGGQLRSAGRAVAVTVQYSTVQYSSVVWRPISCLPFGMQSVQVIWPFGLSYTLCVPRGLGCNSLCSTASSSRVIGSLVYSTAPLYKYTYTLERRETSPVLWSSYIFTMGAARCRCTF
jgi:hypothetical protein